MVPGAIGSQTSGSVIRPAAFCGVVGFKPTHGLIPRSGALLLSRTLDHVGVFARSVEDAALLAETLAGFDEEDPDTRPIARPPLAAVAASEPPLPPRLAFVRTPVWEQAEPVTREAFAELVQALGEAVAEVELGRASRGPSTCSARSWRWRRPTTSIATTSGAATTLSAALRQLIERGRGVPRSTTRGRSPRSRRSTGARIGLRRVRRHPDARDAGRGPAGTGDAPVIRSSAPSGPTSASRR